ncbi:hypothetical protein RND71_029799 [Anisodus tanguticus]|uniref:CHY-type domain-containing protein n=1 Tax=Anisodus tanguticus TaxID=243964 RepID=A0AAE1V4W8_9SOLA|nr:hypothetical protein RND71_029799 [Anisodus tanguticus]
MVLNKESGMRKDQFSSAEFVNRDFDQHGSFTADKKKHNTKRKQNVDLSEDTAQISAVGVELREKSRKQEHHRMAQEELVAVIRRISCDSSLDSEKKSHLMQSLLMRQLSNPEVAAANDMEKFPGQCPSYRDEQESIFGCNHYKRNNKLLAPCCKKLFTCIRCHDETTDHSLDR